MYDSSSPSSDSVVSHEHVLIVLPFLAFHTCSNVINISYIYSYISYKVPRSASLFPFRRRSCHMLAPMKLYTTLQFCPASASFSYPHHFLIDFISNPLILFPQEPFHLFLPRAIICIFLLLPFLLYLIQLAP